MSEQHRGLTVLGKHGPRWNGKVNFVPQALDKPLRWKKSRRIFVNSMSDLFHDALRDEQIDRVLAVMLLCPQHTFQVLTKRPKRMRDYLSSPDLYDRVLRAAAPIRRAFPKTLGVGISNPSTMPASWIWWLVSVEDQQRADERIPLLLDTPAACRGVSYEPALGPIDFNRLMDREIVRDDGRDPGAAAEWSCLTCDDHIDWLIVGGESGHGARPFDLAWARSAVEQCKAAGVPVFVKQLGARPLAPEFDDFLRPRHRKGADMSEWPADLRVREFPR